MRLTKNKTEQSATERNIFLRLFPTGLMTNNRRTAAILLFTLQYTLLISPVGAQPQKRWPSFLSHEQRPDGVLYLPAPPDTLSQEFMSDVVWHMWGRRQRADIQRAEQARNEAELSITAFCGWLSNMLDIPLSEEMTPETAKLISYVATDAINGTSSAKRHYARKRPFQLFGDGTLIPEDEESHRTPCYPSSHAASGWAIALVMAELCPDRQEALLKWGYDYGESRIIAGYHYRSDVEAGRLAASAVVARLHADAAFQEQMRKAKDEILMEKKEKGEK
jgi:acid phosphatase (class A)